MEMLAKKFMILFLAILGIHSFSEENETKRIALSEDVAFSSNQGAYSLSEDVPFDMTAENEIISMQEDNGVLMIDAGAPSRASITEVQTLRDEFSNIEVVKFTRAWAIKQRVLEMYANGEDPSEMTDLFFNLLSSVIMSESDE